MTLLAVLRRLVLFVALTAVLAVPSLAAAAAEQPAAAPPPADVAALGVDGDPAVVPYRDLLGVASKGHLNAAVVDTAGYWVVAADDTGRAIASRIPEPAPGTDFGGAAPTARTVAVPSVFELTDWLKARGVVVLDAPVTAAASPSSGGLLLPLGLAMGITLIVVGMLFIRRSRPGGRGGGSAASHGRMRKNAKVTPPAVRFTDVAGCDEAVEELQEVVTFLRAPMRFTRVGARMPRGVILHGPPGTGKTLLAKAVAGEAGCAFYAVSGSDFVDTYVGVGASRVRDLFTEARKQEDGAIIFFDEIDAIGRARGGGMQGGDSEREATLNQLLVELDGFGTRERVVVIAATNRVDMLDPALTRPGRFDRRVQVGLPAEAGRLAILRLYAKDKPLEDPESLERIAVVTGNFAGADLANLLNEAAIMAARDDRLRITAADLDEGMLRAIAGPEKRDRRLAEGELETIAWHEAGHCLAAELCPTHAKTQRVTILPRGDAGGLALYGTEDRSLTSPQQLHERIVVAMAGRAAEEIGFGQISSGAANDLEQCTRMARTAVEQLGFSTLVGQLSLSGPAGQGPMSERTRRAVESEVAEMVQAGYRDALAMLREHRDDLARLAATLLEREQIDRDDIEGLLGHVAARRGPTPRPAGAARTAVPETADATPPQAPRRRRRDRVTVSLPAPPRSVARGLGAVANGATHAAHGAAHALHGARSGVRSFRRHRAVRTGPRSPGHA
jgi:cell division protease FtsH